MGVFYFILDVNISSTHSIYNKNNITTFSIINLYHNSSNIIYHFLGYFMVQW
ncbi:hypothetical protein CSC40_3204 [Klebsiella pneumoniae]|uniref:Uncharacterized protein n=1 Tax=Klebsiella pneumoniae IS43 TaxID=1432552 RepID=W1DV21_KLEPN|nr:hypothetical protein CSB98_3437 [Klebsiella pneumoniae]RCH14570.1 hypothetical protein CSC40_3204 [Klebsiella pneumoniae]CDL12570.1 hypothetical protein [Klebsiella pneumoniae IS43]